MAYRINPKIAYQVVADEGVLVDLDAGRMLGLNATGWLVWSLLPDHDEPEIAAALSREYAIDIESARAEVREFVGTLTQRGLLTPLP
jgi:hypothetical protein